MNKAQVKKQFDLRGVEEDYFGPSYVQSAFDFQPWPVVASDRPQSLERMQWGLVPRWIKDEAGAIKFRTQTVNARIETVADKPSFRESVKQRRCLVLADGFFEFRELNKEKYPCFIRVREAEAFAMAGLFDEWINPQTGEILRSFTILTTEANSLMEKIHNRKKRMPVILPEGSEKLWLEFKLEPRDIALPFPSEKLEAWTVSRRLTSRTEPKNVPEVQERVDYPELLLADHLNI